jgi:hypothetical protein
MFPDERYVKILRRIDEIECDLYRQYRRIERLRLDLQREWKVLPNGERWTERSHAASEFSAATPVARLDGEAI